MTRILHIVVDHVERERHQFLGSVKDTLGRTEYFDTRGLAVDVLVAEARSDANLSARLEAMDLSPYRAALFELPLYPASLAVLRRRAPRVRRIIRAINAEFFHKLHLYTAHRRYPYAHDQVGQLGQDLRDARGRLWMDWVCARRAHAVLSITDWETRRYWSWVAGPRKALTVPYFTPTSLAAAVPDVKKHPLCLCLMSTANNVRPFTLDAFVNWSRLARAYRSAHKKGPWRFAMTGSTNVKTVWGADVTTTLRVGKEIEQLGLVPDPLALSAEARAVAVLSDLGFGFKTKILDAIAARCWVLLPRALYQRLPVELQPYCIVVDVNDPASFFRALDAAMRPYPAGDPNTTLRERAFAGLDLALGRA